MKETVNGIWEMPKEQFQQDLETGVMIGLGVVLLAAILSLVALKYFSRKWDKEWEKNKFKIK